MFFNYCAVPNELRSSIIEKVNIKSYSNLACSSKLSYGDCILLKKRHQIALPNVYIKDEAIIGYIGSKENQKQKNNSKNWMDLIDCGFDYNVDRLRIMTISVQKIAEAVKDFKDVIHSVDTLIFPKNWAKIPLELLKELIKVTKPRVVNIPGNLVNCKITDFEQKNQKVIFSLDHGFGVTDEDFLQLGDDLKIYSDCMITLPAIIQKIKKWKNEPGNGNYFHYIGKGGNQIPDDYVNQLKEIGAEEVMRKPKNWKERPLSWKDLGAYELKCNGKETITIWLSKEAQQKRVYIEKNS